MAVRTFPVLLHWCMSHGDMTVSDITRWFDRPRATVNTWVNGRTPYGPSGRVAVRQLELLSWAIRNNKGFPIPETLSWTKRAEYIRGIRDGAERHARVPQVRAAV